MKIEFSDEQLVALYRTGGDEARKAIKEALGDEFSELIPVTKRVQTLDDAVRELGDDQPAVKAWRSIKYGYSVSEKDPDTADIMAYVTLRVITEALNEGWKPQFTEGERRWYAWYDFLTKEEVEGMSDEEKEERRVVGRASVNAFAVGGLVFSNAYYVSSVSSAFGGSRLAFKNEELAEYAAKQFGDIYADFCFIPKAACKNEEA
ncbi:hypothetical protein [uncultured Duncaniella sp.]|uniref:hypothetical protein n=1 Tax=uncultured Duncaniella sp. TaxID=2768039 RepID=UPI0025B6663C|nr:hypothetical protein [uncultured Duncaniella sp.]